VKKSAPHTFLVGIRNCSFLRTLDGQGWNGNTVFFFNQNSREFMRAHRRQGETWGMVWLIIRSGGPGPKDPGGGTQKGRGRGAKNRPPITMIGLWMAGGMFPHYLDCSDPKRNNAVHTGPGMKSRHTCCCYVPLPSTRAGGERERQFNDFAGT